jgi:trans-2,3-dihydro-3-hydroxyanthranilate isomerase
MKIVNVHAFSKNGRGGSPTCVVLDADGLSEAAMQAIATETEASHTAFVVEPKAPKDPVHVRFFTRHGQIKNCGHGTIAAHYARVMAGGAHPASVLQQTQEGLQHIDFPQVEDQVEVFLQLNEIQFREVNADAVTALIQALRISRDQLEVADPVGLASPGAYRFLVAVKTVEDLEGIAPDFDLLKEVNSMHASMGAFVYAMHPENRNVYARMFAPNIGVDEDIINGNSSGCLAAYILRLTREDNIHLNVYQGKRFGMDGLVKAWAYIEEGHVITKIGGTAYINHH